MISIEEFKTRTLDAIEKLYAETICINFPKYMDFWDTFVGGKYDQKTGTIAHYPLEFPRDFKDNINECHGNIEKIFQANYAIFTNLAGAHFQLINLKDALKLHVSELERHFLHWEAFETAYVHLGNIRYLLGRIWGILQKLDVTLRRKRLTDYLHTPERDEFNNLFPEKKKDCSILNLRDNFVHSSRIASMNIAGAYYVPKKLPENVVWCEQLECDRFDKTDIKLEEDLGRIEVLLNKTEEVFFDLLGKYLTEKGIKINKTGG